MTHSGNLTLNNLTVQNGRCNGSCDVFVNLGGGIYNEGTLTITNGTITGNISSFEGGGIYNSGTLNVTDSTFSSNSAVFGGGGIHNTSITTIDKSKIESNTTSRCGGGLHNVSGTLTITNTSIDSNVSSGGSAGGICALESANTIIDKSAVTNNILNTGYGVASGILNLGNLSITNTTISGNRGTTSGGSAFYGSSIVQYSPGTVTIKNSTIANNTSNVSTGGIHLAAGSAVITNTILANNIGGGGINCIGTVTDGGNNLDSASSCGFTTNALNNTDPLLDPLADNGGLTKTHALKSGSPAIDAGNNTVCSNTPVSGVDQRGVTRPQGAVCDIGAYEYVVIPIVTASNPSANAVLTSLSSITVVFNQDMLDNATANGAENISNYILVERGTNATFDTTSCMGGVVADDMQQTIASASYNSAGFITSLTLASPLAAGTYRLFVCGTTSIWSVGGIELNNGASDYTVDFTINMTGGTIGSTRTVSTTASSLPKTGFAPNKITSLLAQPATLEYAELGDLWLEIPSLNVRSTIVGVPQNEDNTWDVTWLNNNTGWLNGTAFPTWNGNSVLTAHVTNASGLDGPFVALKSLRYGDQIIVHLGGLKYVYEVRSTRLSRPYSTSFAFESKQDAAYLTLITCQGYNPLNESYLFRRVVRAVLVEVK